MPSVNATDLRKGFIIDVQGELYAVVDFEHVTPGKGQAVMQTKLRHIKAGHHVNKRFRSNEKVEQVFLETREMEFLYPYVKQLDMGNNLLKGFIDLFFEHEGKYYVLDWKTNRLGEDDNAYLPPKINQAMIDHGYVLQGTIYAEAIRRYLALFSDGLYKDRFGGVIYLFLRGTHIGLGAHTFVPTENDFKDMVGEL